ncbi:WXG100 family type VII secretion target [Nocardia amamiensis]|uniref:WXG100 family type VII secretion target n=1 Tax=Nocardia amamiensis TaxID=404578 RepID=UPI00082A2754|nr:WXG100 family type VII secretion target [Nocardia amamiensis]
MSEFTVDVDHLDQIVARLSALAGFINDHLDDIDHKVAGLTGTGWESVAAQAYFEAHTKWATAAREFAEGVRDMSDAARKAHMKYINAAEVNKQMLNGG